MTKARDRLVMRLQDPCVPPHTARAFRDHPAAKR